MVLIIASLKMDILAISPKASIEISFRCGEARIHYAHSAFLAGGQVGSLPIPGADSVVATALIGSDGASRLRIGAI